MPVVAYSDCPCCGAGSLIQTTCCERPICETLTVTFDECGGTGDIFWDDVNEWWRGTVTFTSGATSEFTLRCREGDWEAMITGCVATLLWVPMNLAQCDPTLLLNSGTFLNSACCDGVPTNIIATVSERSDCTGSGMFGMGFSFSGPEDGSASGDTAVQIRPAIASLPAAPLRQIPCQMLGDTLDRCGVACSKAWIRACATHGRCTTGQAREGLPCCQTCGDYDPE